MPEWPLQDAKNRFSAVVRAALAGNPQRVTRRGRPAVVVLAVDDYERLRRQARAAAPSFAEMLLALPQDDGEFERAPLRSDPWIGDCGLIVVTENVRHFEPTGVPVIDPLRASPAGDDSSVPREA